MSEMKAGPSVRYKSYARLPAQWIHFDKDFSSTATRKPFNSALAALGKLGSSLMRIFHGRAVFVAATSGTFAIPAAR